MRGQSILLVSDNAALCAAARINLEGRTQGLRVASVSSADAARRILPDAAPDLILLEEPAPLAAATGPASSFAIDVPASQDFAPRSVANVAARPSDALYADVSSLAKFAPVIVIAAAHRRDGQASMLASGATGYVERTRESWPVALNLVEQRLIQQRLAERGAVAKKPLERKVSKVKDVMKNSGEPLEGEDFGQILRHELNNPLTGILGNAELLLAEIRRNDDGLLPPGGLQRLETITSLAVRMRETIRRISQEWVASSVAVAGPSDAGVSRP